MIEATVVQASDSTVFFWTYTVIALIVLIAVFAYLGWRSRRN